MRVQMLFEISISIRLGSSEQPIIKTHFCVKRMRRTYPMNCALHFTPGSRAAGLTVEVRGAVQLGNVACGVLYHFFAFNDVGVFQAHLAAGTEQKIFWRDRKST